MSKLRESAHSGVRWTTLSAAVTVFSQILRLVILAHFFLSPQDFGLAALTVVFVSFVTIFLDAGFSQALIHHQKATREEISSIFWITGIIGLISFILTIAVTPTLASYFDAPRLVPLIQVSALQFLIQPWGRQFEALLTRDLAFRTTGMIDAGANLFGLVVAFGAAAAGLGVWALVLSALMTATSKTGMLIVIGLPKYTPLFRLSLKDLRHIMSFSIFQTADRLINMLAQRLDQILLARLLGVESVGFYNLASQATSMPVSRINPVVTAVAFPLFAQVQEDRDRLRRGYIEVSELLMAINAPILLGFCAVAPVAIPVIFGSQWAAAVPAVQFLCVVALIRTIGNPVGSLVMAKGRTDLSFYWNVVLLALTAPTVFMGAKLGGATGVAASLAVLQLILLVPSYLFLIRPLIGPCAGAYIGAMWRPFAVSVVMGLGVTLIGHISERPAAATLSLQLVFGGFFYCLAILWIRPQLAHSILVIVPRGRAVSMIEAVISRVEAKP